MELNDALYNAALLPRPQYLTHVAETQGLASLWGYFCAILGVDLCLCAGMCFPNGDVSEINICFLIALLLFCYFLCHCSKTRVL